MMVLVLLILVQNVVAITILEQIHQTRAMEVETEMVMVKVIKVVKIIK